MSKMRKATLAKRIIVVMLAVIMIVGIVFQATQKVNAAMTTFADADTSKTYEDDNFLGHEYSTEFAGRIWTDKTVTEAEDNNFTIKYSALATGKSVTGQTNAPVDVVFVIDTSGSMMDPMSSEDSSTRIVATIDALNDSIEAVMDMNDYTRVAVVAFSEDAEVLLELGRYEKGSRTYTTGSGWNQQTHTVNDYFSVQDSTMYKHAILEGNTRQQTSNRTVTGGTNIQYGYYEGLGVLSKATSTTANINGTIVDRVPALIFLSDGAPTYSSTSTNWWAPAENHGDGPGANPSGNNYYIGNGMKALMTAAYMKEAVNRNYENEISIYSVGMGISHLQNAEKNLAYVTLAPNNNWNANNNVARDFRSAWATYITNKGTPQVNVGARNNWGSYSDDSYTITHPTGDAAKYDIDTNVDALKNLVKDYYDADDAEAVVDVFDTIVSNISLSVPEVPTEIRGGETLAAGGYLTYTDPIGKYMEVKGTKMTFQYWNEGLETFESYAVSDTDGDGIYTFDNDPSVIGSDGEIHKLNLISIRLTTDENGFETLEVKIPAALIPLRVNSVTLNSEGQVTSHTHNGEQPCALTYTVGLIPDLYDEEANSIRMIPSDSEGNAWTGEKLEAYEAYLEDNMDAESGTVNFYSNLFTGTNKILNNFDGEEHTVGDATVTFEPAHTNAFYYIQDKMYICEDEALTKFVKADELDDNTTYYYKEVFYHEDDIETKAVARTGLQLKTVSTLREEETGYWYREPGSIRKNKLQLFENEKDPNETNTAQDYYASRFVQTGETELDGYFQVHLGNNGVLKAKVTGNLNISKIVTADEGLTAPDKEFTFTVDFTGADGTYNYRVVDAAGTRLSGDTIEDGGTIVLKNGQTAEIVNLPAGATYKITEAEVQGFTTSVIDDGGTIVAGDVAEVVFNNHYSAPPVVVNEGDTTVDFGVEKVISGRTWEEGTDTYTFILESNRATTPMPSGSTPVPNAQAPTHYLKEVVVDSSTKAADFGFGEIEYKVPGTYTYTISERVPAAGIPGISYSGAMYQVVVVVEDNQEGKLEATVTMSQLRDDKGTQDKVDSFQGNTAIFTNTYSVDSVSWTPVGTKDYTDHSGTNTLKNGMFQFKISVAEDSPANTPEPTPTPKFNVGPQIPYDTITFTKDHVKADGAATSYYYNFTEVIPDGATDNGDGTYTLNGMTYDGSVQRVEVQVFINSENEIEVDAIYTTKVDGIHYNRVVFFNEYTPEPAELALEGTKTLEGRDWKNTDSFEFVLSTNDANTIAAIEAGTITGVDTSDMKKLATVEAKEADFIFGDITFTKPGTYQFQIKETKGSINGITYDAHTTTVTVVVEDTDSDDDGFMEGQLVATATYNNRAATTDADKEVTDKAAFTNVYDAADSAPINLSGTKKLTGRNMRAGEFFLNVEPQLLEGSTTERAPMGNSLFGNAVSATPNNIESEPIALLNNIVYTAEGKYVYLIKEHIPSDNQKIGGITYDENTVYRVTVTVEDNKEGKLIATPVVEKSTDKGASWTPVTETDIKFNNSYAVDPVTYSPIHLWKNLEGQELQDGQFTFKVEEVQDDVDGMTLPTETEVKNQASGEIVFGDLTFTKPGLYKVKVTEVVPDDNNKQPGITYSDNELIAQFNVTDNGYGKLEVERNVASGDIIFVNTYHEADVRIAKEQAVNGGTRTTDKIIVREGDEVTYYLVITNDGEGDASYVVVEDVIPAGLILVENSISDSGVESNGTITWNIGDLVAGAEKEVSFTVTVPDVKEQTAWENIATVEYYNPGETPEQDTPKEDESDKVEIEQGVPVITIEKTQKLNDGTATKDKLAVRENDIVAYYITVKNTGTEVAEDIVITDVIPEGLTLVANSISNDGVASNGIITWNIDELAAVDGTITVSFQVKVPDVTTKTTWENIATVEYANDPEDPTNEKDPKPSNKVEIEQGAPVITIEKAQKLNDGTATKDKLAVRENDIVTYYITVKNTGTEVAEDVVINDAIPVGLTLVANSISDGGVESNRNITWTFDEIAANAEKTVSFEVTVPDVNEKETWKNIATVDYTNDPEDPTNENTPQESNEVEIEQGAPAITVEKAQKLNNGTATKDKLTVRENDTVTYYITVKNAGTEVAEDIVISDAIPKGLTLVAGSISDSGAVNNGIITWNIGNLTAGTDKVVSFKVTVPDVKEQTTWGNIATVDYTNDPEDPTNEKNPEPSNEVEIEEGVPNVSIEKFQSVNGGNATKDAQSVKANDKVTYTLKVKNEGTESADNLVITDVIPKGLTLVSGSITDGGVHSNGVITWNIGNLVAGAQKEVSFTVTVPDTESEFTVWTNIATVNYPNDPEDPNEPEESNPVVVMDTVKAGLTGVKRIEGDRNTVEDKEFSFKLEAVTSGAPMPDVTQVQNDANGIFNFGPITYAKEGTYTYKITEVNAGETIKGVTHDNTVYYAVVTVGEKVETTTSTSVSYEVKSITYHKNSVDSQSETALTFVNTYYNADLAIVKTQAVNDGNAVTTKLTVRENDKVTYYLTITNNGKGVASNVVITDKIPAGLTLVADSISDNGVESNGTITWNIGSLAADEDKTVSFSVVVPDVKEETTWKNMATVVYNNPDDNPDTDEPEKEDSNEVEIEEGVPSVLIEKLQSINGGSPSKNLLVVKKGDEVTYYIVIKNAGSEVMTGIVVTDVIPAGLTLIEGSISNDGVMNNGVITWNLGDLASDATITVSFKVSVPDVDEKTTWKNIATVDYTNDPEDPTNEMDPESSNPVEIVEEPEVQVTIPTSDNMNMIFYFTLAMAAIATAILSLDSKKRVR